jgi:tetratricopeptide (TPR) repeat protein
LSGLYLNRAEALVTTPSLVDALHLGLHNYSPWEDFDKAIEYAQKYVRIGAHAWNVAAAILHKGDAAFKTQQYEVALEAYRSDEKYLGDKYELYCENENAEVCARSQRDALLTFSMRRGRAYLALKQTEQALAEFDVYIEKAYHLQCQDIFLLRAQAYHRLGDEARALAEKERAKKAGTSPCPFDMQVR